MRSLALLLALVLTAPAAADWPSFHNDERNTGSGGSDYRAFDSVWWTREHGLGQVEASPVLADGLLVLAGSSGRIVALDAQSGDMRWNRTMPSGVVGTPAIDNGRVFVVDKGGTLKSFDLRTGTEFASASVGATLGGLTVHEGSVYVGNEAGVLYRFESERLGKEVWKFDTGSIHRTRTTTTTGTSTCTDKVAAGPIQSTPVVYEGKVIFTSRNNWVYAVNEQGTGALQWAFQTGDIILSSPAVDQDRDRVVVGSYDRRVYSIPTDGVTATSCTSPSGAIHAGSKSAAWSYVVPSSVGNSAVHATATVAGDRIVIGALNGHAYALRASSGQQLWDHDTGAAIRASPAVANGTVAVANEDGRLRLLQLSDGAEVRTHAVTSTLKALKASPALVRDSTFIVSLDGVAQRLAPGSPRQPDLTLDAPVRDGTAVSVVVRNQGDGRSDPTQVRFEVDGRLLANHTVPTLQEGATHTVVQEVEDALPYAVRAVVDPEAQITESDESNNVAETRFEAEVGDPAPTETSPPGTTDTPTPTATTGPAETPPTSGPTERPTGIPGVGVPFLLLALGAVVFSARRRL